MLGRVDSLLIIFMFYAGWFGSVYLAPTAYVSASLVFPVILALFLFFKRSLGFKVVFLSFVISAVGVLFDILLIHFKFISVLNPSVLIIPIWLISIWLLFSLSMLKLGSGLKTSTWFASVLGLVMGPISYKSGEIFEVLSFSHSMTFYVYAGFWALMFPVVLFLAKRVAP